MHFSIDRTVHTTAFHKPVVDHWLTVVVVTAAAVLVVVVVVVVE